jgi:hypothetical protein
MQSIAVRYWRMPKPLKKPVRKLKTPPKTKRPSDPNKAAHSMLAEHMARVQEAPKLTPPLDFQVQYRAHMAKLGKKGGKVGGKRRLETMTEAQRSEIAFKAATARWAKKNRKNG